MTKEYFDVGVMYPDYKSLSDKETKRKKLYNQYTRDLENDKAKQRMYENTYWVTDNKGKLDITSNLSKNTMSTQTTSQSLTRPSTILDNNNVDLIGMRDIKTPQIDLLQPSTVWDENMEEDSRLDSSLATERGLVGLRRPVRNNVNSVGTDTNNFNEQDNNKNLLKDTFNKWRISTKDSQIKSLKDRLDNMLRTHTEAFHRMNDQYNKLIEEHVLTKRVREQLEKDLRRMVEEYNKISEYVSTTGEELGQTRQQIIDLSNILREQINQYNSLEEAYKSLQHNKTVSDKEYEATILQLQLQREDNTKQISEYERMINSMRTPTRVYKGKIKNDVETLHDYMLENNIEQYPAFGKTGKARKECILQLLDNGDLNIITTKDKTTKIITIYGDVTDKTKVNSLIKGIDPFWTITAIYFKQTQGDLNTNDTYKSFHSELKEAKEIPLVEKTNDSSRSDTEMSTPAQKRDRADTFYNNLSPIKVDEKKIKAQEDLSEEKDEDVHSGEGLRSKRDRVYNKKDLKLDSKSLAFDHKPKEYLKGRGLKGAGVNKTRNLRDCKDSMSAFDYKAVGTKFIRLPDLHKNVLNLKANNRTSIVNKVEMSNDLTELVKELVFDDMINQRLYDSLNSEEQSLFVKILKLTHLQYTFKNPLKEPKERLIDEWEKLVGEYKLGNDNQELKKELKALTIDLYTKKVISDNEFCDIMSQVLIKD